MKFQKIEIPKRINQLKILKIPEIQTRKANGTENHRERNRKFGYTSGGCPLFRKFCKFAISYSALVVLITASWTSYSKMDQYFTFEKSCHFSVAGYCLQLNSSRKRLIPTRNDPLEVCSVQENENPLFSNSTCLKRVFEKLRFLLA